MSQNTDFAHCALALDRIAMDDTFLRISHKVSVFRENVGILEGSYITQVWGIRNKAS